MIILFNLPVPPSVNKIYGNRVVPVFSFGSKKKFAVTRKKEKCLLDFESKLNVWMILNKEIVNSARIFMENNIKLGNQLQVDCYINIPEGQLMTKEKTKGRGEFKIVTEKSAPKGVDANNYIKSALDGLTKMTGVDDKYFIKGLYEKTKKEAGLPCMTIVIKGTNIRTFQSLKNDLLKQKEMFLEV